MPELIHSKTGERKRERVTLDDKTFQQTSQGVNKEFCYFPEGGKGSYMSICVQKSRKMAGPAISIQSEGNSIICQRSVLYTTSLKETGKGMRDGGYNMRAHLSAQKVESSWFGEMRQKSSYIIWGVHLKCQYTILPIQSGLVLGLRTEWLRQG